MSEKPIGIFDSGIGGLTVARAVADRLPHVPILYFGDTAHLPYGDKSRELIRHFSSRISHHLRDLGSRMMVVACNSASSNALDAVHDALGPQIPVVDVVSPVVESVTQSFPRGRIGVIGTRATIESGIYQRELQVRGCQVVARATPLLASAIEEGFAENAVSEALLQAYLGDGAFAEVDAMVLGCTHYPLIAHQIQGFLPESVYIVPSPQIVAERVARILGDPRSQGNIGAEDLAPLHQFLVSDLTPSFALGAKKFFGEDVELVESRIWDL